MSSVVDGWDRTGGQQEEALLVFIRYIASEVVTRHSVSIVYIDFGSKSDYYRSTFPRQTSITSRLHSEEEETLTSHPQVATDFSKYLITITDQCYYYKSRDSGVSSDFPLATIHPSIQYHDSKGGREGPCTVSLVIFSR